MVLGSFNIGSTPAMRHRAVGTFISTPATAAPSQRTSASLTLRHNAAKAVTLPMSAKAPKAGREVAIGVNNNGADSGPLILGPAAHGSKADGMATE